MIGSTLFAGREAVTSKDRIAQRAEAAKTSRLRERRLGKEAAAGKTAELERAASRQRNGKLPADHSRRDNDL